MDSSALCEWTQIKINYPSYHGNTTQCLPRGLPWSKDHTLHHHFTLPPKKRLSATLLDIVSQANRVWTFIQAFITTILCQAPHWQQEDTACPLQELTNYWGKRKRHSKIVRHQDIRQRKSAQPPWGTEQRHVTQSRGVRASHMDVDLPWENKLESVRADGGQRKRKMRVYPQQREGPQQRCKMRDDRELPEIPSTPCWNINTPQKDHGVAKSRTRLSNFTFTFHFHALEKEMATHSSVLAWRIPGTEEPSGLPSMGLHRVGYDWSDLAAAAADS